MRPSQLRLFTAVSLAGNGGGVAAASRLCWRAIGDRFGEDSRLITLLDETRAPTAAQKVRFGSRIATLQSLQRVRWILFGHLGLARAQAALPSGLQQPYGVFLHGIEVWCPLPESDRRVLRRAALRIANSEFTARRVMQRHTDIGPVIACPLALAPEDERAVDEALPAEPREPLVLMVGRMDAGEGYKGHTEAIAAWPRVLADRPDAKLVIVGDGDDKPRLEALAARAGVTGAVEFRGFLGHDDLRDIYRRAALFLMPSRGEGFGIVYLEAMAHGLPCIGSRHDAAGDVIVDGQTGFLVAQDDEAEIAERVTQLLRDPALRQTMGQAGRDRVRAVFSFERFSSRLVEAIERHLDSRSGERWPRMATTSMRSGHSS